MLYFIKWPTYLGVGFHIGQNKHNLLRLSDWLISKSAVCEYKWLVDTTIFVTIYLSCLLSSSRPRMMTQFSQSWSLSFQRRVNRGNMIRADTPLYPPPPPTPFPFPSDFISLIHSARYGRMDFYEIWNDSSQPPPYNHPSLLTLHPITKTRRNSRPFRKWYRDSSSPLPTTHIHEYNGVTACQ